MVYCAAFFLLFFAFWVNDNFGEPSLEQILYHMQFGMKGLVDTDIGIVHSFIDHCLVGALAVLMALVGIERLKLCTISLM